MHPTIKFYSNKDGEIFRFLSKYYDINEKISQKICPGQKKLLTLHSVLWLILESPGKDAPCGRYEN